MAKRHRCVNVQVEFMADMVFWSGPALLRALVKGRAWSNHGICSLGAHQGMFPHPREERAFPLGLWLAADGQRDLHWNLELGGGHTNSFLPVTSAGL